MDCLDFRLLGLLCSRCSTLGFAMVATVDTRVSHGFAHRNGSRKTLTPSEVWP